MPHKDNLIGVSSNLNDMVRKFVKMVNIIEFTQETIHAETTHNFHDKVLYLCFKGAKTQYHAVMLCYIMFKHLVILVF